MIRGYVIFMHSGTVHDISISLLLSTIASLFGTNDIRRNTSSPAVQQLQYTAQQSTMPLFTGYRPDLIRDILPPSTTSHLVKRYQANLECMDVINDACIPGMPAASSAGFGTQKPIVPSTIHRQSPSLHVRKSP